MHQETPIHLHRVVRTFAQSPARLAIARGSRSRLRPPAERRQDDAPLLVLQRCEDWVPCLSGAGADSDSAQQSVHQHAAPHVLSAPHGPGTTTRTSLSPCCSVATGREGGWPPGALWGPRPPNDRPRLPERRRWREKSRPPGAAPATQRNTRPCRAHESSAGHAPYPIRRDCGVLARSLKARAGGARALACRAKLSGNPPGPRLELCSHDGAAPATPLPAAMPEGGMAARRGRRGSGISTGWRTLGGCEARGARGA